MTTTPEDAFRRESELRRAMVDSALDCVVSMDAYGRVLEFNPAAQQTFGYTRDEAVGAEMANLIVPPSLRQAHRAGLARYLKSREPKILDTRLEITGMHADGYEFPVELTITRIDLPGPPLFTGFLRDITRRKADELAISKSRRRMVEASYAARRQIERDLHDGAQQQLVALGMALRLTKAKAGDQAACEALLDEAIAELQQCTHDLRELARGIHPAVLTEGGIKPAVESLVARSPAPVTLEAAPDERFAAHVEATAYFVVAEALVNVARYAEAQRATVRIDADEEGLQIDVSDDGRGGADASAGSGLRGLADRTAAVGGRLEVDSPEGGGTRLWAQIPFA